MSNRLCPDNKPATDIPQSFSYHLSIGFLVRKASTALCYISALFLPLSVQTKQGPMYKLKQACPLHCISSPSLSTEVQGCQKRFKICVLYKASLLCISAPFIGVCGATRWSIRLFWANPKFKIWRIYANPSKCSLILTIYTGLDIQCNTVLEIPYSGPGFSSVLRIQNLMIMLIKLYMIETYSTIGDFLVLF